MYYLGHIKTSLRDEVAERMKRAGCKVSFRNPRGSAIGLYAADARARKILSEWARERARKSYFAR